MGGSLGRTGQSGKKRRKKRSAGERKLARTTDEHFQETSQNNQTHYKQYCFPLLLLFLLLCIHRKLYSPNKTLKQSWFTGNLIKAACLHRTPLCTAKSNLLSIRFAQRSIHLHSRLLGTICGHLGLGERNTGREDGESRRRV